MFISFLLQFVGLVFLGFIAKEIFKSVFKSFSLHLEDRAIRNLGGLKTILKPLFLILEQDFQVNHLTENGSRIEFILVAPTNGENRTFNKPEFIKVSIQIIKETYFIEFVITEGYFLNRNSHKTLFLSPKYHFENGLNKEVLVGNDLLSHIRREKHELLLKKLKMFPV
jgi:hypothetical protein